MAELRFTQSTLRGMMFGFAAFGIFATHDVFIKYLGALYSPFQIIFFSALFSFPLMIVMVWRAGGWASLRPVYPGWVIVRVLVSQVSTAGVFYAFSVLKLAETYTILFTTPLFITAFSMPFLGEKVGLRRWSAVFLGFCGVLLALEPGASGLGLGHISAFLGAMGGAFVFLTIRKVGQEEGSTVLMVYGLIANGLIMGLLMLDVYKPMPLMDLGAAAMIAILSFVAMLCMIAAYRRADASVVAPTQYSQLIWALVYGALIFGESVSVNMLLGAAVIIGSGLYIAWRESRLQAGQSGL